MEKEHNYLWRDRKTRKEESVELAEEANWQYKKRSPKHAGLKKIKLSNSLYKHVQVEDDHPRKQSRKTGKVKNVIKRTDIPLRRHNFNGEDIIRILDFLAHFTSATNIQKMSVAQAFAKLKLFFEWFVLTECKAMKGMTPLTEEEITCEHDAAQYLLTYYAQAEKIIKAH